MCTTDCSRLPELVIEDLMKLLQPPGPCRMNAIRPAVWIVTCASLLACGPPTKDVSWREEVELALSAGTNQVGELALTRSVVANLMNSLQSHYASRISPRSILPRISISSRRMGANASGCPTTSFSRPFAIRPVLRTPLAFELLCRAQASCRPCGHASPASSSRARSTSG